MACPNCRLGIEVRARVLDELFWTNLAITVLPLAIVGGVATALHGIGRPAATVGGTHKKGPQG